jgi:ABC-type Zn uptake system ZnuABC Zn-binding protein ZnuA
MQEVEWGRRAARGARVALVVLVSLLASSLACTAPALEPAALAGAPIPVVATTTDLRSLTEAVGGARVVVASLVPSGMDPEDYQPRPRDALRLGDARLLVRVGLDYDLWLDRLLAQVGRADIDRGGPGYVDSSRGIAVLELGGVSVGPGDGHAHGSGNPHYWLDPGNAEAITALILEALARVDPPGTAGYEANRMAFLARLNAALPVWQGRLTALTGTKLVSYHDSWPYFARRFRLDFVGVIEVKPGVPPSPQHLANLVALMRREGVGLVVREPHEPEREPAFVAAKAGAQVLTLAASVGALPGAGDYLALFDTDVAALQAAAARP